MVCFDYVCACNGTCCHHEGHQYQNAYVIIEVPLEDETTIYVKGFYEQAGYVLVGSVLFYPSQFDDIEDQNIHYKANAIWTFQEQDMDGEQVHRNCFKQDIDLVVNLTDELLAKCIRRDA